MTGDAARLLGAATVYGLALASQAREALFRLRQRAFDAPRLAAQPGNAFVRRGDAPFGIGQALAGFIQPSVEGVELLHQVGEALGRRCLFLRGAGAEGEARNQRQAHAHADAEDQAPRRIADAPMRERPVISRG